MGEHCFVPDEGQIIHEGLLGDLTFSQMEGRTRLTGVS